MPAESTETSCPWRPIPNSLTAPTVPTPWIFWSHRTRHAFRSSSRYVTAACGSLPFTFYRGAAAVMASDLSRTATTDLRVQLCGDAHLSNFGVFNGPDRRLVFDLNDFDETTPGPFEWDLKRLAASVTIAGRNNEFTSKEIRSGDPGFGPRLP